MPRTKGAKNILNARALAARLAELEEKLNGKSHTINDAPALAGKSDNQTGGAPAVKPDKKPDGENISLVLPKRITPAKTKPAPVEYGCGNVKFCTYTSRTKFAVCPVCGVNNTWASDT